MKYMRQLRPPHLAFLVVLSLVTIAFGIGAQTLRAAPPGVARLKGPWQAALVWSGSGCGPMAGVVNFTLNQAGVDHKATLRVCYKITLACLGHRVYSRVGVRNGVNRAAFQVDRRNAGRAASAVCGSRRSFGDWTGWHIDRLAGDGHVATGDPSGRGRAQAAREEAAAARTDPETRWRTQTDSRRRSHPAQRSREAARPCDAWRSGDAIAVDMQELATAVI